MAEDVRQSLPDVRGGNVYLTIDGRDPTETHRLMGELFAHATRARLSPIKWQLGYFNMRDLIRGRDPGFKDHDHRVRMEVVWGCTIEIVAFYDLVNLVTRDANDPVGIFRTLVPEIR